MRNLLRPSIWTQSPEALGLSINVSTSSLAYPASNDALFVPVFLSRPALVKRLFCMNGATASGNIDMGIYTKDGSRIISVGSIAQSGTTTAQYFDIADTFLTPGYYYMAVAKNDTTGTLRRLNVSIIRQQLIGMLKATSSFPLPATVTFTTVTALFIPNIGMDLGGLL